jgi:hypothetical protein
VVEPVPSSSPAVLKEQIPKSASSRLPVVRPRDARLPNRQAANEKIEAHFLFMAITSGLPVTRQ